MKNILFLSFSLIISSLSFSQNYCQQYQQFKSNSNYGEDQAKENYLGLMCTCLEEGVIDEAQENRILNALNKYKSYGNIPTKCKKKDGYSSQINLTSSNCQSTAANFRHANGQAQAYGADFLLKICQCETGVATAQDERRLLGLMRTVRNQYIAQGGISADLGPIPTKCGRLSTNKQSTYQDQINREFNPDLDAANRAGRYTKEQGLAIVNQLANQLQQYDELNKHTSPEALLDEYNTKTKEIENLQEEYQIQSFDYGYATGESISNNINNKNYSEAAGSIIGFFQAQGEMKKQKELMELKKQELKNEKNQQFNLLYNNLIKLNKEAYYKAIKMAAFQRVETVENYYLKLANFYTCKNNFASNNFSYSNTAWKNAIPCGKAPLKPITKLESNLISEKIKLEKIVERKLNLNKEWENMFFIQAACAFQAELVRLDDSFDNLIKLSTISLDVNPFLSLSTLKTASNYNIDQNQKNLINNLLKKANKRAGRALLLNLNSENGENLKNMYQAGLLDYLKIDEKTLYEYLIYKDDAENLEKLLNVMVNDKNDIQKQELIRKTIILSSAADAVNCLKLFDKLGFDLKFKLKNHSPLEVAKNSGAKKCIYFLNSLFHPYALSLKELISHSDGKLRLDELEKVINRHTTNNNIVNEISFIVELSFNELVVSELISISEYVDVFKQLTKANNLNAYNNKTLLRLTAFAFKAIPADKTNGLQLYSIGKKNSDDIISLVKNDILPLTKQGYFLVDNFWMELFYEISNYYYYPNKRWYGDISYESFKNQYFSWVASQSENLSISNIYDKPLKNYTTQQNNLFLLTLGYFNDNNHLINYLIGNYNFPIDTLNLWEINLMYWEKGNFYNCYPVFLDKRYKSKGISLKGLILVLQGIKKTLPDDFANDLLEISAMRLNQRALLEYISLAEYISIKETILFVKNNSDVDISRKCDLFWGEDLLRYMSNDKQKKSKYGVLIKKDLKYWKKLFKCKQLSEDELKLFSQN